MERECRAFLRFHQFLSRPKTTSSMLVADCAYSGAWRSRVRSHPDQQSEVMPITVLRKNSMDGIDPSFECSVFAVGVATSPMIIVDKRTILPDGTRIRKHDRTLHRRNSSGTSPKTVPIGAKWSSGRGVKR